MANTTYVLYGPGKDSSEVLGQFPTGLMKTAYKANFLCPICVPVNSEYDDLADSHDKDGKWSHSFDEEGGNDGES